MKRGGRSRPRRVLVVGGQGRGVGKTALIEDVIKAFPAARWAAAKITPHEHGSGPLGPGGFALEEERDGAAPSDSSRFLAAGACRSFWLRVRPGCLPEALAALWASLGEAKNIVLESNAVLEVLDPTACLAAMDPRRPERKPSFAALLARADAVVARRPFRPGEKARRLGRKPAFLQPIGAPLPAELAAFLRERFFLRGRGSLNRPVFLVDPRHSSRR